MDKLAIAAADRYAILLSDQKGGEGRLMGGMMNELNNGRRAPLRRFEFTALPQRVLFGPGTLATIRDEVARLRAGRALVLSTPQQADTANAVAGRLADLSAGTFSEAAMHTPAPVTERAVNVLRDRGAGCVVAVGGGSATGLGKAIALRTDVPQIAVPTTYAGSEMTPILGETQDGAKTTQRTLAVLPEVVVYDVNLTSACRSQCPSHRD